VEGTDFLSLVLEVLNVCCKKFLSPVIISRKEGWEIVETMDTTPYGSSYSRLGSSNRTWISN